MLSVTPLAYLSQGIIFHQDWSQYGIDWSEEITESQPRNEVCIDDLTCPLTDEKFDQLKELIDPLQGADGFGIELYIDACCFVADNT